MDDEWLMEDRSWKIRVDGGSRTEGRSWWNLEDSWMVKGGGGWKRMRR